MVIRFRNRLPIRAAALALLLGTPLVGLGQSTDNPGWAPAATRASTASTRAAQALQARSQIPSEFGIADDTILQIGVAAFHPRSPSATLTFVGNGLSQPNVTGFAYWAPVNLPEGAVIDFLDLYACDTNPTVHMTAWLTGYSGSANPATTEFWGVYSQQYSGNGCQYQLSAPPSPPFVVNNDVEFNGGYDYVINLAFGATDGTHLFKGVDIWWKRQVSPAPVSASFSDVPTSSPIFKFVEALYASGITAGCGGGKFCPDAPLTRGQMAVFLSVALGLNWPH